MPAMAAITDWSPVDLLPGLWVLLLGAGLAAALRKWLDPVPWRVLAVFAAVLLILFGPVLFGGKVLLPLDGLRGEVPFQHLPPVEPHGNFLQGDLIQLVTPSLAAVRAAWADGRWPLWNERAGPGMPLLADPQAQAFQPLALLGAPLPLLQAPGVTAALRVLMALVFGYLWLRRQGLSMAPALAGSLAYGLGGFLLLWLGWPIANTAALLPLVLYGVARCDDPGRRRDGLLLAVGVLTFLLGGHPETILYTLVLVLLFLLDKVRRRPRGMRRPLLVQTGIAFVIAGAVAAPALLPAAEYLPRTMRAARGIARAGAEDLVPSWLPIVAPNAYGNSRFIDYWGLTNTNEDASGFVGTATLFAALLSLGARRRFPQEVLALVLAALCLLLIAPMPWGPAVGSRRLLLPLAFCLTYLGACTLERFRLGEVRRWPLLLVAVALGLVIAWGYAAHPDPGDPDRMAIFRFGWLRWQLRFLVLATLVLLVAASWQRRGRSFAVTLVAVAVAAELMMIHGPANPPMPHWLALPIPGPIRFLQTHLQPGYRMAALGQAFPPNLASLYGITDARIYNPMAPQDWVETTAPITVAWHGEHPEFGKPGHPLYPRIGVRYLLAAPDAALPPPLVRVYADSDGTVWEVPGALPQVRSGLYRPGSFLWGLALAALGLAMGAAAFVPRPKYGVNIAPRTFPAPPSPAGRTPGSSAPRSW